MIEQQEPRQKKPGFDDGFSGRVSIPCSTSHTRHVTLATNLYWLLYVNGPSS
jgi:hypothetical protein